MRVLNGKCKKDIVENNEILCENGKEYELVWYANGEIQVRTEQDQYLTVSDSGSWKFRDYFDIVQTL